MSAESIKLQQAVLDTMKLVGAKAADDIDATTIIKGEILELLDEGTRRYKVSYKGAIYEDVYATSKVSYSDSTVVYILVPNGDFTQRKIIISAVTPLASDYVTEDVEDSYISISDNLFGTNSTVELKSWEPQTKNITNLVIRNQTDLKSQFKEYLNKYKTFSFTAKIKTNIDINHQIAGNYGLIFHVPFKQKDAENKFIEIDKEFIMDNNSIEGNIYGFNEFQEVRLYFTIDDTLEFDNSKNFSIEAFVENFNYTSEEIKEKTGQDFDIHIKDISIKMIEILKESDVAGYHLSVVSNNGNYFLKGENTAYNGDKTLSLVFKVNGKTTLYSSYDCYWFEEDASIKPQSEYYIQTLGGLGWKCLNIKENITYDASGKRIFTYKKNDYTLKVKPSDVISSKRYKCVLTKADKGIVVNGIIQLVNLAEDIETQLVTLTGANTFATNIGDVHLVAKIKYPSYKEQYEQGIYNIKLNCAWQRFDKNGNYKDDLSGDKVTSVRINELVGDYFETEISFPCNLIEGANTINCSFYRTTPTENNVILATEQIYIKTSDDFKYSGTITGGDVLFKYDMNGNAPNVGAYDGQPASRVDVIEPLSFKVFESNGKEIAINNYNYCKYTWQVPKPKNSMIKILTRDYPNEEHTEDEDYDYYSGYGINFLSYTIRGDFDNKRRENTIFLTLELDKNILNISTNIKFIKEGQNGTNGSEYSAVIYYQSFNKNGGQEEYFYGQKDEEGNTRKAQFLWNQDKKRWYRFDAQGRDSKNTKNIFIRPMNGTAEEADVPVIPATFVVKVYKNGHEINLQDPQYSSQYDYMPEIEWSMYDSVNAHPSFVFSQYKSNKGIIAPIQNFNWDNGNTIYCNVIEAKITVGNKESTDIKNQEILYVYYPIEITRVVGQNIKSTDTLPSLEGGFSEVEYSSDGKNPKFSSNKFTCKDAIVGGVENENYQSYTWQVGDNFVIRSPSNPGNTPSKEATIEPKTNYDNILKQNYIKANLVYSDTILEQYKNELRNFTSKKIQNEEYVDYLEEVLKKINSLKNVLNYNYIIEHFKSNESTLELLNLRKSCIDEVKNMLTFLDYYKMEWDIIKKNYPESSFPEIFKRFHSSRSFEDIVENNKKILLKKYCQLYNLFNVYDLTIGISILDEKYDNIEFDLLEINSGTLQDERALPVEAINILVADSLTFIEMTYRYDKFAESLLSIVKINNKRLMNFVDTYLVALKDNDDFKYLAETPTFSDIKNREEWNIYEKYQDRQAAIEAAKQNLINIAKKEVISIFFPAKTNIENHLKNSYLSELLQTITQENISAKANDLIESSSEVEDFIQKITAVLANDFKPKYENYEKEIENLNKEIKELDQKIDNMNGKILNRNRDAKLIHIKPIVLFLNRREMSYLNGWNGNKIYLNNKTTDEAEILFAPQLGAGEMSDKGFTGVTLGVRNFIKTDKASQIGMFGYNEGLQTLFLNAKDGSAIFGTAGGQIIIDPTFTNSNKMKMALLYNSSYFGEDYNNIKVWKDDGKPTSHAYNSLLGKSGVGTNRSGMVINLTDSYIHFVNDNEGKIYSGKHSSFGDNDLGFNLSNKGLSINGQTSKFVISTTGNPVIYSGNHSTFTDTSHSGFYLGQEGLSIINGQTSKFVVSTTGNPVIYSGGHNSFADTSHSGFYLGQEGLSIINGQNSKIAFSTTSDPVIYSGGHSSFADNNHSGFYLGQDGMSIVSINGAEKSRLALSTTGNPVIYSGNHSTFTDTSHFGFYLGQEGLSIIGEYEDPPDSGIKVKSKLALSTSGNPEIYSGGHNQVGSSKLGFYLGEEGFSIKSSTGGKFVISTEGDPMLFSGSHDKISETNEGFYLGNNGLSIGNSIRITSTETNKAIYVGRVNTNARWKIDGGSDEDNNPYSYIGYEADSRSFEQVEETFYWWNIEGTLKNTTYSKLNATSDAKNKSVYIGTDGLRLGKKTMIDNQGTAYFKGHIESTSGMIGGFTITSKGLFGYSTIGKDPAQAAEEAYQKGYLTIEADGDMYISKAPDGFNSRYWKLTHDGKIQVDSVGSYFGGVSISADKDASGGKSCHYTSQASEPFQGTCVNHIIAILNRRQVVNSDGAVIGYVGMAPE